jgi:hypothetical protein
MVYNWLVSGEKVVLNDFGEDWTVEFYPDGMASFGGQWRLHENGKLKVKWFENGVKRKMKLQIFDYPEFYAIILKGYGRGMMMVNQAETTREEPNID